MDGSFKTRHAFRLLCAAGVLLALGGCFAISQYHLGYHHYPDGRMVYDVVSRDSVMDAGLFEEECVKNFVSYKMESLKPSFSPDLNRSLDTATLRRLNKKLKKDYGFNGGYERIRLILQSRKIDKAALKDAFQYYDTVSSNYLLKGSTNAILQLYITRINGEYRLSGFEIVSYGPERPDDTDPVISFIYPESMKKKKDSIKQRR